MYISSSQSRQTLNVWLEKYGIADFCPKDIELSHGGYISYIAETEVVSILAIIERTSDLKGSAIYAIILSDASGMLFKCEI